MVEQKSAGKTEGNEEGTSLQQQLIALHSINTSYHLLSTDDVPNMGLNMHFLFQFSQQPHDTINFIPPIYGVANECRSRDAVTWFVSGRTEFGT